MNHYITEANDYQKAVWQLVLPQCQSLEYLALGLGEAGEIQGKIKKVLRGDKGLDGKQIAYELGDLLFYVAALAWKIGYPLDEIATMNITKLQSRKERGVLQGDGDNR